MSDTTEKNILDSIPDLMTEGPEGDVETSADTTTTTTTTEGSTESGDTTTTATVPLAQGGQGQQTTAPATPPGVIQRRDGLIEVPNKDNPNARDLVDPATGQVVAKGGNERRFFETAQQAKRSEQQAQQRAQQLQERAVRAEAAVQQHTAVSTVIDAANQRLASMGKTERIDAEGHMTAINLLGRYYADPVGVLTDLVSEVKARGYNIPFLETGISPGMDAIAVQKMMDQRFAPITQAAQEQQRQQQLQQEAKTTLDNFLASEPDAVHNIGIIGEMLTSDKTLNIHSAWSLLMRTAYQAGLDPTQPLKPQYEAALAQRNGTSQQPAPVARNLPQAPSRPLPNGRLPQAATPVADAKVLDENSSYSDIIRRAMAETGYRASQ